MAYINNGDDVIEVERETYGRQINPYKEKETQLAKDYDIYYMPQKIKIRAIEIYMIVLTGITLKRKRRRSMMCKCVYEAYKENNIPKDPILLAIKFDITIKKLREAQNEFYQRIHGTDLFNMFPKRHLTAKELLIDLANAMNIIDFPIVDLNLLIDNLYQSSILLIRVAPRDIAICVLHWYSNKHGEKMLPNDTMKITLIARAKLVKILSIIENIMSSK